MNRYIRFLCVILILTAFIGGFALSVGADAQYCTVNIKVFVQENASVAKNQCVDICFRNVITGEEVTKTINCNSDNQQMRFLSGEYEVKSACLSDHPEITFTTSTSNMVVDDSGSVYFTVALKDTVGDELLINQLKNEYEVTVSEFFVVVGALAIMVLSLVIGVVSLVNMIKGGKTYDYYEANLLKAKGRYRRHLFLGLLFLSAGIITALTVDNRVTLNVIFYAIYGFSLPFGFIFAAKIAFKIAPKEDDDDRSGAFGLRDYEVGDDESGGGALAFIIFVVLWIIATVTGPIIAPITLIKDKRRLRKAEDKYYDRF